MSNYPATARYPINFRRYSRLFYTFLAVLSLYIIYSIFLRQEFFVLRPGDLGNIPHEIPPEDDNSPFAHEPIGIGTLRDVREDNFYRGGTLTLKNTNEEVGLKTVVLDPYPDYNSDEWQKEFKWRYQTCKGPRGNTLNRWDPRDIMTVYLGLQKGTCDFSAPIPRLTPLADVQVADFPSSLIGSYSALGLETSVCTNRYSRLIPYGYQVNDTQDTFAVWKPPQLDWSKVDWGALQSKCAEINADRYIEAQTGVQAVHILPPSPPVHVQPVQPAQQVRRSESDSSSTGPRDKARSAVVLRTWHDMEWTENHKQYVRSLTMELSLHSGGEYEVFILCHVKDMTISLDSDPEAIQRLKSQFVPVEFAEMTILFNDGTLTSTVAQYWQPVQIFAQALPHFEFYWQLEMDSRFTGHAYEFLERAAEFAKAQPRKYLWERNSYFYIPGSHGTWHQFKAMVSDSMKGRKSIWGPMDVSRIITDDSTAGAEPLTIPVGPTPPVASPEEDHFEWGVGEESDLISFLPIFDPTHTNWVFKDNAWNLREGFPRQVSPVAMGRISKKLVDQMHYAQSLKGVAMASEMTAPTVALWHGLKAVHVPQPIYLDGKWTSKELGRIMNPGPAEKINGAEDSVWNWDHLWDHILYRMSYIFTAQTSENLYRRWMGYKIDPSQYTDSTFHQDPQGRNWFETGDLREDLYGPLCFPSMLLHPVKNPEKKKGAGMAVPV
ncbi:hypothetical protein N7488_006401 [Penicillium malachiteum]|nr:hypothetical protein N7488_006401 [Penicillium malachiteum]